ncbi:MAG: hypothetical protein EBR82_60445 [Caulobacteraceae bacterium]|nr:hypothetical protein [Caulobacteraceae bacterium]
MGLFNHVKIEQDLPLNDELKALGVDFNQQEFQTKELEPNIMSTYIIRDNKLFELKIEGHWEDNPNYVVDNGKFREFFDKNKWVKDSEEEVFRDDFTGTFTFSCYVLGKTKESYDLFPDWKCVVIKGLLTEISLITPVEKNSSEKRIEADEIFQKQLDDHERKMRCPVYSFYFKYYVKTMNLIEWKLCKSINFIIRFLNWLQWKGIRKIIRFLSPR